MLSLVVRELYLPSVSFLFVFLFLFGRFYHRCEKLREKALSILERTA